MSIQPGQLLQPAALLNMEFVDANFIGIKVLGGQDSPYKVTLAESVVRILSTRLGERVMRPTFGSNLYQLRDRHFNNEWRVLATRWIFEAISECEPRARFKQLHFTINASGKHDFYLELDTNE